MKPKKGNKHQFKITEMTKMNNKNTIREHLLKREIESF